MPILHSDKEFYVLDPWFSKYGPGPAALASLGKLSEMQILGPHPRSADSETLVVSPAICIGKNPLVDF